MCKLRTVTFLSYWNGLSIEQQTKNNCSSRHKTAFWTIYRVIVWENQRKADAVATPTKRMSYNLILSAVDSYTFSTTQRNAHKINKRKIKWIISVSRIQSDFVICSRVFAADQVSAVKIRRANREEGGERDGEMERRYRKRIQMGGQSSNEKTGEQREGMKSEKERYWRKGRKKQKKRGTGRRKKEKCGEREEKTAKREKTMKKERGGQTAKQSHWTDSTK